MCPYVAFALDLIVHAARADGLYHPSSRSFRPDSVQASQLACNPDPRMHARPGYSLHRYGTELDLGPPAAHRWLAANAQRFHFVQRYAHEPWHYGYTLNARSRPAASGDGTSARAIPS